MRVFIVSVSVAFIIHIIAAKPPTTVGPRASQTTRYGRTTKPTQQMAESEVKKSKRTRTTTLKKGERTEISPHAMEHMGRTVTPATEPAGGSATGRPRKPLPVRARVTSKPQTPKQPDASTSSNVGRRPRPNAAARAKVAKNPLEHPQVSTSADVLSSIVTPISTETSRSSTYVTARRSQGLDTEADPETQVSSSDVTAVALGAPPTLTLTSVDDAEHRMSLASTNNRKKVEGSVRPQASTSTAIHSHVSELTTQPLSPSPSIPDAQLFEFVTWATDKAETETSVANRRYVHQEISQPQYSVPLPNDHNIAKDMRPGMDAPLTTEAVEDPQEPKTTPSPTRAAEVQLASQDTLGRSTAKEHDNSLLRISPLATLLGNVKLSEIANRGEASPSSDTSLTTSAVSTPAEGGSENSSLAPTPAFLEESQTPDTSTVVGYDSDATDATASTLVTSHVPTPLIQFQKPMSTRRTARSETAESTDDQSSQRLTIKLPAQSLAPDDTLPTAESVSPTQSRLPVASTSQPTRRSLRTRNLAVQIPAGSSSSSRPLSGVTMESANHRLSPLSTEGAATFSPEHEPRFSKKRKLGRAT